ncbi:hypothetical protein HK405_002407, partial [Cladochytrium tenue]
MASAGSTTPADAAALAAEVASLSDHNARLARELADLKKERLAWRDSQRHADRLERDAAAVHDDLLRAQTEAARARRAADDLERRLRAEIEHAADARRTWLDQEQDLRALLRAERDENRRLRSLGAVRAEPGFADDYDDDGAAADPHDVARNSTTRAAAAGASDAALVAEIARLNQQVLELAEALRRRDESLAHQEQDVLELQRTVTALMDDIESGAEQARFDGLGASTAAAGSDQDQSVAGAAPGPAAGRTPPVSRDRSNERATTAATTTAPSGSLADELMSIGENAPTAVFSGSSSSSTSLKARMATLGLGADGNREVLNRRLRSYLARRRRWADEAAAA